MIRIRSEIELQQGVYLTFGGDLPDVYKQLVYFPKANKEKILNRAASTGWWVIYTPLAALQRRTGWVLDEQIGNDAIQWYRLNPEELLSDDYRGAYICIAPPAHIARTKAEYDY